MNSIRDIVREYWRKIMAQGGKQLHEERQIKHLLEELIRIDTENGVKLDAILARLTLPSGGTITQVE